MSVLTFKYRIRAGDRRLKCFAIASNQVRNFCVATQREAERRRKGGAIVQENRLIAVCNVSSANLARTRVAKSVLDAGWSSFRHMLRYKAARRQAAYVDVDERWSSQVCSAGGTMPASRPRGIGDLGIRRWECSDCGASHDRDVNAAMNILTTALEHQRRVGEITVL
jgi:putative transposase